ncbi:MAG: beta-galactosidase [Bacteroidales bacterium]|nr:beta-galactosidase [Bacteroidales bacterium]
MKRIFAGLLLSAFCGCACAAPAGQHTFAIADGQFLYDGKPTAIYSGEMHYERVPAPYWRHRLKMMKAMGLNAVATYVFWNFHEVAPGKWDWTTDEHNLRKFVQTAQEEDMLVILRPGPYCCAEWEYGGYPWWLQQQEGLVVRCYNQPFLDACRTYVNQLADQVRDLQITHGGPIVMVQAENEFGSYVSQRPDIPLEEHKRYSAAIRQTLIDAGFDIPMFTSDGSWLFEGGAIEGALPTANGEDNVENLKKVVDAYHGGKGPYMVAEFYPGWLDHWNEPFVRVPAEHTIRQTQKYLDNGVNFNFYMVHGGTNFGFWAGANYNNETNIQPDITSYDYDAPISEAGWATEKYMGIRELMKKYVKYDVPEVPERIPVVKLPELYFDKTVDVLPLLEQQKPVTADEPLHFEDLGQGFGYVLYRRHFNQPISGVMRVPGIADFATVYVDGKKVGELNRVLDCDSLQIDIPFNSTLDILVENLGRINYGARIVENHKGITQPITIGGSRISGNWNMYGLPLSQMPAVDALPEGYKTGCPVYYRAKFTLDKVGDTFLDMEKWGKGIVFVNGHNLGRYWKVGPQQTLYLPGCWLKEGENEVVVFEQLNDHRKYSLSSVTEPVLEKLQTASAETETADEVIARLLQENAALREQITALQKQMEEMKAPKKRGKK